MSTFLTIPKSIVSKDYEKNKPRIIPYIIHQTFKTNIVPLNMFKAAQSWFQTNPNYNYNFYDDNDIETIIKHFNTDDFHISHNELWSAYNLMNTGAGKADLFRYIILYNEGGCYFDIDTMCIKAIDTYIDTDDELVSGIGERGDLHQWGMIYKKKHPFIKRAIELSVYNILNRRFIKYKSLEGLTGPPCLDMAIKLISNLHLEYRFKPGKYTIKNFLFHVLNGDYFGNNVIFKYKGYNEDLQLMKMKHWGKNSIFTI